MTIKITVPDLNISQIREKRTVRGEFLKLRVFESDPLSNPLRFVTEFYGKESVTVFGTERGIE